MAVESTPSQTVGPYFAIGLPWPEGPNAAAPDEPGGVRRSPASSTTARARPIPDAMIETWQADGAGAFGARAPGFRGFARVGDRRRRALGDPDGQAGAAPGPDGTLPRRSSTCRCSPAGCCTAASRGSTSATKRRRTGKMPSWRPFRRSGVTRCWRRRPTMATDSTSTSRATARPSSSTSDAVLLGGIFARGGAAAAVSDAAFAAGDARRRGRPRARGAAGAATPTASARGRDAGRVRPGGLGRRGRAARDAGDRAGRRAARGVGASRSCPSSG